MYEMYKFILFLFLCLDFKAILASDCLLKKHFSADSNLKYRMAENKDDNDIIKIVRKIWNDRIPITIQFGEHKVEDSTKMLEGKNYNVVCAHIREAIYFKDGNFSNFLTFSCVDGESCIRRSETLCEEVTEVYSCKKEMRVKNMCYAKDIHTTLPLLTRSVYSYVKQVPEKFRIIKHTLKFDNTIRILPVICENTFLNPVVNIGIDGASDQFVVRNGYFRCRSFDYKIKKDNLYFNRMFIIDDYDLEGVNLFGTRYVIDETFFCSKGENAFKIKFDGIQSKTTKERLGTEEKTGRVFMGEKNAVFLAKCFITGKQLNIRIIGEYVIQELETNQIVTPDNVDEICIIRCSLPGTDGQGIENKYYEPRNWACPGNKIFQVEEKSTFVSYIILYLTCENGVSYYKSMDETLHRITKRGKCVNSHMCILRITDDAFRYISHKNSYTIIKRNSIYPFVCSLNKNHHFDFKCLNPDSNDQETWKKNVQYECTECVAKGFEGKPIFKENNEGHQFEENMKKFMPGKTKLKCQGTQYIQVGAILTEVKEIVCFNNSLLPLPNKFLCNDKGNSCPLAKLKEFKVNYPLDGYLAENITLTMSCKKSSQKIDLLCKQSNLYVAKEKGKIVLYVDGKACTLSKAAATTSVSFAIIIVMSAMI